MKLQNFQGKPQQNQVQQILWGTKEGSKTSYLFSAPAWERTSKIKTLQ
jgi:hypothetical protein